MYAVAEGKMEIVTILIEEGDAYLDDVNTYYHSCRIELRILCCLAGLPLCSN